MLQHCCMTNTQSFSYRTSLFEMRFIRYRQKFGIKIIQSRSSSANFVMEVLTTEPYLSNPESNYSKFVDMFIKLCLKSGCDLVGIDFFVLEKSDDHSLIILHHKWNLNGFWRPGWKDNFFRERHSQIQFDLLTFRRLCTVEIYYRERQTL
jgi:hypothetical protein